MRLWSLHPKYLDSKGLVALWREGLLAKAVLEGKTRGYTHHPQLERFREHPDPLAAIVAYLRVVLEEAIRWGYRFDPGKLEGPIEKIKGPGEIGKELQEKTQGQRKQAQNPRKQGKEPQKKVPGLLRQEKGVQKQVPGQRKQVVGSQRIEGDVDIAPILLTTGQLAYEWGHLLDKLKTRDPDRYLHLKQLVTIEPHPLMRVIPGPRAPWEIVR